MHKNYENIPMKLVDWINIGDIKDKNKNRNISENINAIDFLIKNPEFINWDILSGNKNPRALDLLEKNKDKISWGYLSTNPNAIWLLEKNLDRINWNLLSLNPNAVSILEKNLDKINWNDLSRNEGPDAIKLLEKHPKKINWLYFSQNPSAVHLFEKNIKKLKWNMVSSNTNPKAIEFLEKYPEKILWECLNSNPNPKAVELLIKNPQKIKLWRLCMNPYAIEYLEKYFSELEIVYDTNGNISGDILKILEECAYGLAHNYNAAHIIEKYYINRFENTKYAYQIIWWGILNTNPGALYIFQKYKEKLHHSHFTINEDVYERLCNNPAIFVCDYDAMRESHKELKEELIANVFHPLRIEAWLEAGMDIEDL